MKVLLLALAVVAATGCSLLNNPDRDYGPPPDGGIDANLPDTGPPDAGPDTAMQDGDVPDCTRMGVELCSSSEDEDCDGLVDCADFECTRDPACCAAGSNVFETEAFPLTLTGYAARPEGMGPSSVGASEELEFGGATPRVLIRTECSPLIRGLRLQSTFAIETLCTSADCPDYGSLVLTPARDFVAGADLPVELEVRIGENGSAEVRLANDVVVPGSQRPADMVGSAPIVTIDVAPGLNARGTPALFATVTLTGSSTAGEIAANVEFLLQSQLLTDETDCRRGPGLHVAFEGVGTGVHVASVTADERLCANPSHFEAVGPPTVDHASIPLDWASGGIGAPALASYKTGSGTMEYEFQLLVDGTNTQRSNELFSHVGFSIGGGVSANGITTWAVRSTGTDTTTFGEDVPQPPTGEPGDSTREPSLVADLDAMGMLAVLKGAYARELGAPGVRDIFGIHLFQAGAMGTSTIDEVEITPDMTSGCESLRDPLLLPAGPLGSDGYWLFYTCHPPSLGRPRIEVVKVSTGFVPTFPAAVAIDGTVSGAIGQTAVYGAEGVARVEGANLVIRLWFVATDRRGTTTIGMAQSETPLGETQLYAFRPYPANPVLRATDLVLGSCTGTCFIEGLAATRVGGITNDVRLLVARSVNDVSGTRYELVPLEQFWR